MHTAPGRVPQSAAWQPGSLAALRQAHAAASGPAVHATCHAALPTEAGCKRGCCMVGSPLNWEILQQEPLHLHFCRHGPGPALQTPRLRLSAPQSAAFPARTCNSVCWLAAPPRLSGTTALWFQHPCAQPRPCSTASRHMPGDLVPGAQTPAPPVEPGPRHPSCCQAKATDGRSSQHKGVVAFDNNEAAPGPPTHSVLTLQLL